MSTSPTNPIINPTKMQIENAFSYHPPHDDQVQKYVTLRERAKQLAYIFDELCPPSRELSLALTNLEQSVMWANAAIVRHS